MFDGIRRGIEQWNYRTSNNAAELYLTHIESLIGDLATATDRQVVVLAVLSAATEALGAQAGLVVVPIAEDRLTILSSQGYAPGSLDAWQTFPVDAKAPLAESFRTGESIWLTSLADWTSRYPAIVTGGAIFTDQMTVAVPLFVKNEYMGSMGITFAPGHVISDTERVFVHGLANECAAALERCRLYAAERDARLAAEEQNHLVEASAHRLAILSSASRLLSSSLDFETTLRTVAQSVVPNFADWCVVDIVATDGSGSLQRLAVVHDDPAKVAWANELQRRFPARNDSSQGVPKVVRTGIAEYHPDVTDEMIAAGARSREEAAVLQNLGFRSVIIAPLRARGRALGAITFVTTKESNKRYSADDLDLAEEIGQRAGIAIDHARLFTEAQREIDRRIQVEAENNRLLEESQVAIKKPAGVFARCSWQV